MRMRKKIVLFAMPNYNTIYTLLADKADKVTATAQIRDALIVLY